MKNLKSFTITTDGAAKRISIMYDEIDDTGKVIKPNMRLNRVITDTTALKTVASVEKIAASLMEE